MKGFPTRIRGVMARRILVNFRVRPEALQAILPFPFRPKLVNGWGLGGICLIKLEQMRPEFLPAICGVSSENAAHRIAVEWQDYGTAQSGVFIPRRDTNSLLNLLAGGRLFPGVHHLATFQSEERGGHLQVRLQSRDRHTAVQVDAQIAADWPTGSVFRTLEEASAFLKAGCCGWSPCESGRMLEGVELNTDRWEMHPLHISQVHSSFFSDETLFLPSGVEFDSALLMRGIPHTWTRLETAQPCGICPVVQHHRASALFELP